MCSDCFDKQYYGFPSYTEYEEFEAILDLKTRSHKIEMLESENEDAKGLMDYRLYFNCNTCSEKYVLSIPDHAWRGYFLTEQNAFDYRKKVRMSDKDKRNGCLIFILLICTYFLYSLFANF